MSMAAKERNVAYSPLGGGIVVGDATFPQRVVDSPPTHCHPSSLSKATVRLSVLPP